MNTKEWVYIAAGVGLALGLYFGVARQPQDRDQASTESVGPIAGQPVLDRNPPVKSVSRTVSLGTFTLTSDEALVTDPSYPDEKGKSSIQGTAKSVRFGEWTAETVRAEVEDWGVRCLELTARCRAAKPDAARSWKVQESIVGVDSGQAGIFDAAHFQDPKVVPADYPWRDKLIDPDDRWYSLCCDQTLHEPEAGVVPFGVVSSSGLGDGGYEWSTQTDDEGKVVAIRIVFIDPNAKDEEE